MNETTATMSPTAILTNKEAADYLKMSPRTLTNWRLKGEGPRYFHLTDNPKSPVRYRLQDILDWIEEQCKGW